MRFVNQIVSRPIVMRTIKIFTIITLWFGFLALEIFHSSRAIMPLLISIFIFSTVTTSFILLMENYYIEHFGLRKDPVKIGLSMNREIILELPFNEAYQQCRKKLISNELIFSIRKEKPEEGIITAGTVMFSFISNADIELKIEEIDKSSSKIIISNRSKSIMSFLNYDNFQKNLDKIEESLLITA